MKKLFLFGIVLFFLLALPVVSAIEESDIIIWSDYNGTSTTLIDERGYQDGAYAGLTRDNSDKPTNHVYSLTGSFTSSNKAEWTSDAASQNIPAGLNRSIIIWFKTPTGNKGMSGDYASPTSTGYFGSDGAQTYFYLLKSGNPVAYSSEPIGELSGWHMYEGKINNAGRTGDSISLYIDSVLQNETAITGITFPMENTANRKIGYADESGTSSAVSGVSQYIVIDGELNQTERECLYNSGDGRTYSQFVNNCLGTPVVSVNESTERTTFVTQSTPVTFTVGSNTIVSSTFEIDNNDTIGYFGYSYDVEANNNNDVYCTLEIDGVVVGNDTRTNTPGDLGNGFILTNETTFDIGNYTADMICTRLSGVGQITVSGTEGVGHFLIDQYNQTIPYNSTSFSTSVSSGYNFTLVDSFDITVPNKNATNFSNFIILEGGLSYYNNAGSKENISGYANIGGTNCTFYPRTTASGGVASLSSDCIISNVTPNSTYTVNIYGNGSNSVHEGKFIVKTFFLSPTEAVGGTGAATGLTFSGDTDIPLFSAPGGNENHAVSNVFTKVSTSITTDLDTLVTMWITIANGTSFRTRNFSRDFTAGETGVLIGQDIIENLPLDDYNTTIWGNCGTSGANCTFYGGQSGGYITDTVTTIINSFEINVYDFFNNASINNFNVTNGGFYETSNGSIVIFTSDDRINFTIQSDGYINKTVTDHNTSNDLNTSLTPLYYLKDVYYYNYISEYGVNYTDSLNFTFEALCPVNESHRAYLTVGNVSVGYIDLVCDNTLNNNSGVYVHNNETNNAVFMNWTGNSFVSDTTYFTWDLYAPVISVLNFSTTEGFVSGEVNVSMRCYDTLMGNLTYNLSFNGNQLFYGNLTNNTLQYNTSTDLVFGNNTVLGYCNDLFYTSNSTFVDYIYKMSFSLIDERTNLPPSFAGFDSAIVYYDDNTTQLDLIGGITEFNFTSTYTDKLRFEFIYNDSYVVTRYFDVSLFPSDDVRVCANNHGEDYYTQLLTSSSSLTAVVMKSVYSDCVVAADYLRFAYQDALILRAQTINAPYYLYTWEDNEQVFLASIDGSIESYINIDTLIFSQSAYNLDLLNDNIAFEKLDNQSIKIYYREPRGDNSELTLTITRTDNDQVVFSSSDFSNPNEFTLYLDYSTWPNLQNDTLLMAVVEIVNNDGSEDSFTKFFNLNANSGTFTSRLAFFLSFTLALFGITFVAARTSLGWFGFIIMIIAISLGTFAPVTEALLFLQAIEAICLVFIGITLFKRNYATVT